MLCQLNNDLDIIKITNISINLLWENSSPTNTFNPQTVEIPELINSNMILIRYLATASTNACSITSIILKRTDYINNSFSSFARYDSSVYITYRGCIVDWENGTISFAEGVQNGSKSNNRHIPLDVHRIY